MESSTKLVVILGPTASGKSSLAVLLAKKYHGEIVSADSRQVYRGMDVGSGKITGKEMQDIPHWLLDVASPKRRFTVAQFQTLAKKKIQEIHGRGKLPMLVGGTGLYVQAVVDGIVLPEVKPNPVLRKALEQKTAWELFTMLKKLDPGRAKSIDRHNPRRLVRALEIVLGSGKPVPAIQQHHPYKTLLLGLAWPQETLKGLINTRLVKRLKGGMVAEVERLHAQGVSWKRLEELGLEYRYVAQYLQKKLSKQEMAAKIQRESEQYAKRQMTWFKRDQRIRWITTQKEAQGLLERFLQ